MVKISLFAILLMAVPCRATVVVTYSLPAVGSCNDSGVCIPVTQTAPLTFTDSVGDVLALAYSYSGSTVVSGPSSQNDTIGAAIVFQLIASATETPQNESSGYCSGFCFIANFNVTAILGGWVTIYGATGQGTAVWSDVAPGSGSSYCRVYGQECNLEFPNISPFTFGVPFFVQFSILEDVLPGSADLITGSGDIGDETINTIVGMTPSVVDSNYNPVNASFTFVASPEPSTWGIVAAGLFGLAFFHNKRKSRTRMT